MILQELWSILKIIYKKEKKNINFGNCFLIMKNRRSFIIGVKSTKLSNNEKYFIKKYKPWGIILFSRNLKNFNQIKKLTNDIKSIFNDNNYPILIDQEGGRVNRLKKLIDTSFFSAKFLSASTGF